MTQNAQLVYHRTNGMKTAVKPSIHMSVCRLDEAFHTVRLCEGSELDGSMNGNMAAPTVPMMPIQPSAPNHQPMTDLPVRTTHTPRRTPTYPASGTSQRIGWL